MKKITPTPEQTEVKGQSVISQILKVNSVAGSGKTSTLRMVSEEIVNKSLYIAFNKPVALEARQSFPSHVECRTTHSLAYRSFGADLIHKLSRPSGAYKNVAGTPSEISKYYRIKSTTIRGSGVIEAATIGLLVKEAVRRYEQNSSEDIKMSHVNVSELKKAHPRYNFGALKRRVVKYAKKLWEERIDEDSPVLATHDTYLKLFQLSKPKLDYSTIYLDEAQDTGDTVLDIVLNQMGHAKIIIVGDTYQSIYSWRGAVNAMEKVQCETRHLTKSFRYGEAIAAVATRIIDGEVEVKGNSDVQSEIVKEEDLPKPFTKLYRTNAALISDALEYIEDGISVSCVVDTKDYVKFLNSAIALKDGDFKNAKHDKVLPYSNWLDFVEAGRDDPQLKSVAKAVGSGFATKIIANAPKMKQNTNAQVTLSTAHKSKGMEWDNVALADDFPITNAEDMSDQERNLLYVAATRAIRKLSLNAAVFNLIMES